MVIRWTEFRNQTSCKGHREYKPYSYKQKNKKSSHENEWAHHTSNTSFTAVTYIIWCQKRREHNVTEDNTCWQQQQQKTKNKKRHTWDKITNTTNQSWNENKIYHLGDYKNKQTPKNNDDDEEMWRCECTRFSFFLPDTFHWKGEWSDRQGLTCVWSTVWPHTLSPRPPTWVQRTGHMQEPRPGSQMWDQSVAVSRTHTRTSGHRKDVETDSHLPHAAWIWTINCLPPPSPPTPPTHTHAHTHAHTLPPDTHTHTSPPPTPPHTHTQTHTYTENEQSLGWAMKE